MYSPLLIVLTEVVMTPLIVWIIDYTRKNMGQLGFRPYAISIVILVMMGSMLDAFFYYIVSPKDFFDTVLSATIGMVLMTAALVYIFWIAVNAKKSYTSPMSVIGISGLITWNEVSMALLLFSLTGVHVSARGGGLLYVAYFGRSVTYYLFLAPHACGDALLPRLQAEPWLPEEVLSLRVPHAGSRPPRPRGPREVRHNNACSLCCADGCLHIPPPELRL
ncbi:hypothetical protein [Thermogymnomonas acidicola]|uniref:hypothetical protein n=1 Tax=Thermogymnomonas acidicola TaxID=399579 RepID=UPI0013968F14|nr:hypothetical protein [Thermogymnomonas acidicola]